MERSEKRMGAGQEGPQKIPAADSERLQKIVSEVKQRFLSQMPVLPSWISGSSRPLRTPCLEEAETLEQIRDILGDCTRCRLHSGRRKIVFGQGNPHARLMFVGEGPGAEEDRQGLAFVGKAGQLLTRIIEAIGLTRDEVYIANIVKCRPPGNRDPQEDEVATCIPFLRQQIRVVRPSILCTLGAPASKVLLNTREPITRLRGKFYKKEGIDVMPTFHPAYLLRNPEEKRPVWEDMQKVQQLYGESEIK